VKTMNMNKGRLNHWPLFIGEMLIALCQGVKKVQYNIFFSFSLYLLLYIMMKLLQNKGLLTFHAAYC